MNSQQASSEQSPVNPFDAVVAGVEGAAALDGPGRTAGQLIRSVLSPRPIKQTLNGSWLGHALHPMLTDLVIGSFTSATLLDLLGGSRSDQASERLIAIGIAAYGPTALTGASDWSEREGESDSIRRTGLVHAGSNAIGLGLYTASLRARRRGAKGRGVALGLAGAGVMGFGGFLGGHLTLVEKVGVGHR